MSQRNGAAGQAFQHFRNALNEFLMECLGDEGEELMLLFDVEVAKQRTHFFGRCTPDALERHRATLRDAFRALDEYPEARLWFAVRYGHTLQSDRHDAEWRLDRWQGHMQEGPDWINEETRPMAETIIQDETRRVEELDRGLMRLEIWQITGTH